jgi:outer membrane protein assembly factor BamA
MRQNKSCWLAAVVLAGLMSAVPLQAAAPPSHTLRDESLYRADQVHFSGNTVVSDAQLRSLVPDGQWQEYQGTRVTTWQCYIAKAIEPLLDHYRSLGFLDVRVTDRLCYSAEATTAIEFRIEEGPRYRIRNTPEIAWFLEPHPFLSPTQPATRVRAGDYYTKEDIDADISRIESELLLRHLGYELRSVLYWPAKDRGEVSIRYEIVPPPPRTKIEF